MRLVFDTEFMEDGKTIELISIGIVREDGAEYYAENRDANYEHANPWVRKNVLRYLDCAQFEGSSNHAASCKPPEQIASEIREFAGASPEWWAYYADYDWVVLCQLYGRMIDLPMSWPMYCRDLKQEIDLHYPTIVDVKTLVPPPVIEHHALADARWTNEVLNLTRFNPLVGAVETDVVRQENTGHGAPPRRSDQLRKKDPT